jgi:shikimate kinase
MLLFLIGFMGSGKSTLGKRLAKKIDYEFIDMDELLEQQEGMSVTDIFEQKGEEYFRQKETELIQQFDPEHNKVIATGGGSPCFKQNMEIMNHKGITIYLRMTPAGLVNRLRNATELRPLLKNLTTDEQLLEYISGKLQNRDPYYLLSKCIIKAENVKPEHVISLVFDTSFS